MEQDNVYNTSQQVQIAFKKKVFLGYNELRNEGLLIDIKLNANGRILNAHKVILAAHSKYFKKIFTSGFKESKQEVIDLIDTDPNLFEKILDAIYIDKYLMLAKWEDLIDTINIIDYYEFDPAIVIIDLNSVNVKNRVKDYIFLIKYMKGKNYTLDRIEYNNIGKNLNTAEEILDLSDEQINEVLSNYYVGDPEVYYKIIKDLKETYHRSINPNDRFELSSFYVNIPITPSNIIPHIDNPIRTGKIIEYNSTGYIKIQDKLGQVYTFLYDDIRGDKVKTGDIVTFYYSIINGILSPKIDNFKTINRR